MLSDSHVFMEALLRPRHRSDTLLSGGRERMNSRMMSRASVFNSAPIGCSVFMCFVDFGVSALLAVR